MDQVSSLRPFLPIVSNHATGNVITFCHGRFYGNYSLCTCFARLLVFHKETDIMPRYRWNASHYVMIMIFGAIVFFSVVHAILCKITEKTNRTITQCQMVDNRKESEYSYYLWVCVRARRKHSSKGGTYIKKVIWEGEWNKIYKILVSLLPPPCNI